MNSLLNKFKNVKLYLKNFICKILIYSQKTSKPINLKIININIDTIDEINQLLNKDLSKKNIYLRFWIPPEKVCTHGGFRCKGGRHPFIAFLLYGVDALDSFYKKFTPKNIAQMYFQPEKGYTGEDLPPWELPWIPRSIMSPPAGEGGLSIDEGVSYFGPVTEKKLKLECQRISMVKESILKKGYMPDTDINGLFFKDEKDFVFFVRGGKHRAAVLGFLGYQRIPVTMRHGWPFVISEKNVSEWSLVKSGDINEKLALKIFRSYLQNNGIHQFNQLKIQL